MKKILFSLLALTLVFSSCVKDEVSESLTLPSVTGITIPSGPITPSDAVVVTAKITDIIGTIVSAQIKYSVDGAAKTPIAMTRSSGDNYTGTIPTQVDKAVVVFSIIATNSAGKTSESATSTYTVGAIPINYAAIKLNEVNGGVKFIELYNTSNAPIDISGMIVLKNDVETPYAVINAETTIAAKAFAVIAAAGITNVPNIVATGTGGLSGKQLLKLELFSPNGVTSTDIFMRGTSNWGDAAPDIASKSMARCPDGTGSWMIAETASPDAANPASSTIPIP